MSDAEILKTAYSSPGAFKELFDRHNKRFLNIARRSLSSKEEAEDAVQETFIRIYKHGEKFLESRGNFRNWSNTILKNCIIDQIRKRKASTSLSDELESVLASPDEGADQESQNYFSSVLGKMGSVASEILRLRYVLGKSFKEIGKIMSISSGSARVRAHRAKKAFVRLHNQLNIL
jgi:RNA polymerase sigma-70 factor, ECF subfamily